MQRIVKMLGILQCFGHDCCPMDTQLYPSGMLPCMAVGLNLLPCDFCCWGTASGAEGMVWGRWSRGKRDLVVGVMLWDLLSY